MSDVPTREDLNALRTMLEKSPLSCKGPHTIEEDQGVVYLRHIGSDCVCMMMPKEDYEAIRDWKEQDAAF